MSTLERADEIEADFYRLKAQEWACESHEAKERIEAALVLERGYFVNRRSVAPGGNAMAWKDGDWVVYDLKVGQIKKVEDTGIGRFSDGWFETSGYILNEFRPLTLRNKQAVEYMDLVYNRLREIDGHHGFNYPDIHRHFSNLAIKVIDTPSDDDAKQFFDAAAEFVNEARKYTRIIQGVNLFRGA